MAGRYGEPYQSAYRSDEVLHLPLKLAQGQDEWDITGLPQALRELPPTITAAGWMAQVTFLRLCRLTGLSRCKSDCQALMPLDMSKSGATIALDHFKPEAS